MKVKIKIDPCTPRLRAYARLCLLYHCQWLRLVAPNVVGDFDASGSLCHKEDKSNEVGTVFSIR